MTLLCILKVKIRCLKFVTDFIQFGHADFKYVVEIWPSRQNFAQMKL